MIYIGVVESIDDKYAGERIKARVLPVDRNKPLFGTSENDTDCVPYAFPLLPKMMHVKPKVGEAVLIFVTDDNPTSQAKELASQRYYVGPIISQPQFMYNDSATFGATTLLNGSWNLPSPSVNNNGEAVGAFAKDDEIAIYGRQNSDIILSDSDLRIRCGARLANPVKNNDITFNSNSSFIKLKYHTNGIHNPATKSTEVSNAITTIVGDEINLISNCGNPYFKLNDTDEQITDATMEEIMNKAHVLPYGDVLVDFLLKFLSMFKNHTHKYNNDTPCRDDYSNAFDSVYGYSGAKKANNGAYTKTASGRVVEDVDQTFKGLGDKLLSKHVRIN